MYNSSSFNDNQSLALQLFGKSCLWPALVNDYLSKVGTKHWILQVHHLILLIMFSEHTLQGLFGKTKTFLDKTIHREKWSSMCRILEFFCCSRLFAAISTWVNLIFTENFDCQIYYCIVRVEDKGRNAFCISVWTSKEGQRC